MNNFIDNFVSIISIIFLLIMLSGCFQNTKPEDQAKAWSNTAWAYGSQELNYDVLRYGMGIGFGLNSFFSNSNNEGDWKVNRKY